MILSDVTMSKIIIKVKKNFLSVVIINFGHSLFFIIFMIVRMIKII